MKTRTKNKRLLKALKKAKEKEARMIKKINFKKYLPNLAEGKTEVYDLRPLYKAYPHIELDVLAYMDSIGNTKETGFWMPIAGTKVKFFKYGMNKITSNLATGGWHDKVDAGWEVVEVWQGIEDNEIFIQPVRDKIEEVVYLLEKGAKVCVKCAAGINRSNSIATSALTYLDKGKESIEEKYRYYQKLVKSKVDRAWMDETLAITCQEAIKEMVLGIHTVVPWRCIDVEQINRNLYRQNWINSSR